MEAYHTGTSMGSEAPCSTKNQTSKKQAQTVETTKLEYARGTKNFRSEIKHETVHSQTDSWRGSNRVPVEEWANNS